MEIKLHDIKIRDIVLNYVNNDEEGVIGYNGKLNIRPKYQREFVYNDAKRDAVIDTVRKGFPLNVMYWVDNADGTYEVLDGQQRTVSICEYFIGNFAINYQYFHNLESDEKEQILDYELKVYFCKGSDKEKLEWFKTINIAGEKLADQELRNAIYTGEWLTEAKRHFSKTGCPAYGLGSDYLNGTPIRQDYLETVLKWINYGEIEEYMASHQHDNNCNELWLYFQSVINWVNVVFPNYRKEMKGVEWGLLYNEYKNGHYDSNKFEQEVKELMMDEDVTNKKGIYEYLFDGKEKHLNIRGFSNNQKREAYERQVGICPMCSNQFDIDDMEADHITPWHDGGKTITDNCQMLCRECNRRKSGR